MLAVCVVETVTSLPMAAYVVTTMACMVKTTEHAIMPAASVLLVLAA